MPRRRVIVISPRKSGTHLIQRLMTGLGYSVWGDLGAPANDLPKISIRERLDVARLVLPAQDAAALDPRERRQEFVKVTNLAWTDLAASWAFRLGVAAMRPYWPLQAGRPAGHEPSPVLWTSPFSATPAQIAWMYHAMDLTVTDPRFLSEWRNTGEPAIVLNVRDPRDALVSMVNFLAGAARHGSGLTPDAQIYGPVLAALPDLAARLAYALRDPTLPFFGDYRNAVPLYAHPDVCRVSFEELIGPRGGGDEARQLAAIDRIAMFLDVPECEPEHLARSLFDTGSFTFHHGQIGMWRSAFDTHLSDMFMARNADLLTALGYA
jgi:hypothetical protein